MMNDQLPTNDDVITMASRDEVAAHIAGAFAATGTANKAAIIRRARETHSDERIGRALAALPDRTYDGLPDLWEALTDLASE